MFSYAPSWALTLACIFTPTVFGASLDEWRSRSIYQVMTDRFAWADDAISTFAPCQTQLGIYCGGSWRGVMDKLDYIQGMGFDAIWISPIVNQMPQVTPDGSSYAGYWQQDLYTINTKYGALDDLHALVDAVHSRGMLIMMDVVVNHMAFSGAANNIDYSVMNPFNDEKYYHRYCEMDYSGNNLTSLEECWLGSWFVPLADINTELDEVRDMFGEWVEGLVKNYTVDGLRIDAGVNVAPDFFTSFVKSAGVFSTAEVYLSDDEEACKWQDTVGSILNYPQYWALTDAFKSDSGSISDLVDTMASVQKNCKDSTALGTFSENQDIPRFANHTSDLSLAKNIATFVIMSDGIPIIYQGQEQHLSGGTNPYTNREPLWQHGYDVFAPLYQHIGTLNQIRHFVINNTDGYTTQTSDIVHQDDNTLVMARGSKGEQLITIMTNSGEDSSDGSLDLDLSDLGYKSGTTLMDVLSCTNYTVGDDSSVSVAMSQGLPRVLWDTSKMKGSTICGMGGERFGDKQAVTMTTVSTTVASTPTVFVETATIPPVSTTASRTMMPTPSAGAAFKAGLDAKMAVPAAMAALALANGLV